jgi:hypothetical protein
MGLLTNNWEKDVITENMADIHDHAQHEEKAAHSSCSFLFSKLVRTQI